jgi:trans-2,3-dihydro-3-hydroxyanthranilate isomerase
MTQTDRTFAFQTVDVFTQHRFGGNPLAVFPNAVGLSDSQMQALAAEFNLSETTFVLPPVDPQNTARVRIFNRTSEMPFAGHPSIGTAYVLAQSQSPAVDVMRFEVPAGIVIVEMERDDAGSVVGGKLHAPQPLSLGETCPAHVIATCLGLSEDEICVQAHPPILASLGNPYVIVEVAPDALAKCVPNIQAFKDVANDHPQWNGRFSLHVYAQGHGCLNARMFAPLAGTYEDPATGSANAPLGALLLSLTNQPDLKLDVHQGYAMGRPSLLHVRAFRQDGAIYATVAGRCVPVLRGEAFV